MNQRFAHIAKQAVCESCNRLIVKTGNGRWEHATPSQVPHSPLPALGTTRTVPEESR